MPHESSHAECNVGEGQSEAGDLQDVRGDISTEAYQAGGTMREARMPEGKRAQISRVAVGVKHRVDRLKAIGNGQVPAVAALAWQILGGPVETEAAPSEPGAASNETSADIAPAAGR